MIATTNDLQSSIEEPDGTSKVRTGYLASEGSLEAAANPAKPWGSARARAMENTRLGGLTP